jgi:hypothetical protein
MLLLQEQAKALYYVTENTMSDYRTLSRLEVITSNERVPNAPVDRARILTQLGHVSVSISEGRQGISQGVIQFNFITPLTVQGIDGRARARRIALIAAALLARAVSRRL